VKLKAAMGFDRLVPVMKKMEAPREVNSQPLVLYASIISVSFVFLSLKPHIYFCKARGRLVPNCITPPGCIILCVFRNEPDCFDVNHKSYFCATPIFSSGVETEVKYYIPYCTISTVYFTFVELNEIIDTRDEVITHRLCLSQHVAFKNYLVQECHAHSCLECTVRIKTHAHLNS